MGVEGGVAHQGQHGPGAHVEGHDAAGERVGQGLDRGPVQVQVDRQPQVPAGARRPLAVGKGVLVLDALPGVDLHVADAVEAAQAVLEVALHPGLAHVVAGHVVAAAELVPVQLLPLQLPHVSHQVRGQAAVGVETLRLDLHLQGPLLAQALLDDGHGAEVDVPLEAHQAVAPGVPEGVAARFLQGRHGQGVVLGAAAAQEDAVRGPVAGQDLAVAVEDEPAGGLQALAGDAVVLGSLGVVVGLQDLQVEEAQQQDAEEQAHHDGQAAEPARPSFEDLGLHGTTPGPAGGAGGSARPRPGRGRRCREPVRGSRGASAAAPRRGCWSWSRRSR